MKGKVAVIINSQFNYSVLLEGEMYTFSGDMENLASTLQGAGYKIVKYDHTLQYEKSKEVIFRGSFIEWEGYFLRCDIYEAEEDIVFENIYFLNAEELKCLLRVKKGVTCIEEEDKNFIKEFTKVNLESLLNKKKVLLGVTGIPKWK